MTVGRVRDRWQWGAGGTGDGGAREGQVTVGCVRDRWQWGA